MLTNFLIFLQQNIFKRFVTYLFCISWMFRGLVFDYKNYARHVFANATAKIMLLKRLNRFQMFFSLKLVSFFQRI